MGSDDQRMWLALELEGRAGAQRLVLRDPEGPVAALAWRDRDQVRDTIAAWVATQLGRHPELPPGPFALVVGLALWTEPNGAWIRRLLQHLIDDQLIELLPSGGAGPPKRAKPVPRSEGPGAPPPGDREGAVGSMGRVRRHDEADDEADEADASEDDGGSFTAPVPDGYVEKAIVDIHGRDRDADEIEPPRGPPPTAIAPPRQAPPSAAEPVSAIEPSLPIEPVSGITHARPPSPDPADAPPPRSPPLNPAPPEARSVDIGLRRRGVKSALPGEEHDPLVVRPTTRLAAGLSYDVCVLIAAKPLVGTLLESPAPSIDGLVPKSPDGHRLEVTVFGLDFALTTRAVRELWLPPAGPSQLITFTVRAPDRLGPARLRVVVSHDGHALQSFVMAAELAHVEQRTATRALIVTLEHAATQQFDNLAQLRPRAATAIVNDDPRGGHSITLKRGAVTGTFAFTDEQIRGATARVRAILEAAAHAPSFEEPAPLEGTPDFAARRVAYHATIKTLAVYGRQLHLALLNNADLTGKQLVRELAKTADQRLQLIHVTRSLVIPWATVYDGWTPVDLKTDGLAVCDGFVGAAPCGHGDTEQLICVRRFWGMRHDLELLLGSSLPRDAITSFHPPTDRPPLRILQGARLRSEKFLPDDYTRLLAQPDVAAWTGDVYQLLEPATRPAVLVAMGHFSIDEPAPGAQVHAIDLEPVPLTDVGVSQQALTQGDWTFPHSIVLLMACSSAVAAADALTGMIDAFASAGAAAIIGTESTVFPRLSARVACTMYRQLVESDGKLSAALRALRWELAHDATPLAFTFTAYGNADLAREDAT